MAALVMASNQVRRAMEQSAVKVNPKSSASSKDENDTLYVVFKTQDDYVSNAVKYVMGDNKEYVTASWKGNTEIFFVHDLKNPKLVLTMGVNSIADPQKFATAIAENLYKFGVKQQGVMPEYGVRVELPNGDVVNNVVVMEVRVTKRGGVVRTIDLSSKAALQQSIGGTVDVQFNTLQGGTTDQRVEYAMGNHGAYAPVEGEGPIVFHSVYESDQQKSVHEVNAPIGDLQQWATAVGRSLYELVHVHERGDMSPEYGVTVKLPNGRTVKNVVNMQVFDRGRVVRTINLNSKDALKNSIGNVG